MRLRTIGLAACGVWIAAGCGDAAPRAASAEPAPGETSAYRVVACAEVAGAAPEGLECGFLKVPQNRVRETGRDIELFLVRHGRGASNASRPPLVILAGGPGAEHTMFAARLGLPRALGEALGREIIYFEQRGIGPSIPDTACPAIDEVAERGGDEKEERAALDACVERWTKEQIDIASFNTLESAADIASLPKALGVDRIDIFAGSYGTRLAFQVMARHPEAVRAAVLGGVLPPGAPNVGPGDASFEAVLARAGADYQRRCQGNASCSAFLPGFDLARVRAALADKLNTGTSVRVAGLDFDSVAALDATLYSMSYLAQVRNMFFAAMFHAANDTSTAFFARISGGDAAAGEAFVRRLLGAARTAVFGGTRGMTISTNCYDTPERCSLLPNLPRDYPAQAFTAAPGTAHPVLMLAGALDPTTPEQFAVDHVRSFPNGRITSFACLGHDTSRLSNRANGRCLIDQTKSFLDEPSSVLPPCAESLCEGVPLVPTEVELSALAREYVADF